MDGGNEEKVAIKFSFKADLSLTETLVLVQKSYGNEAVNWSNVFRWYSRFQDGRELVEDDDRGGHPKSTRTEVNIAAVADLVKNDRRIASRMIAELPGKKIQWNFWTALCIVNIWSYHFGLLVQLILHMWPVSAWKLERQDIACKSSQHTEDELEVTFQPAV
jgi:hypothetical protein